jgi:hypothetical protein
MAKSAVAGRGGGGTADGPNIAAMALAVVVVLAVALTGVQHVGAVSRGLAGFETRFSFKPPFYLGARCLIDSIRGRV